MFSEQLLPILPILIDTKENLNKSSLVIPNGMIAKEESESQFKIGNGNSTWSNLGYIGQKYCLYLPNDQSILPSDLADGAFVIIDNNGSQELYQYRNDNLFKIEIAAVNISSNGAIDASQFVKKDGDTITGQLTLVPPDNKDTTFRLQLNAMDVNNPPTSSDTYRSIFDIRDKNSQRMGAIQFIQRTNGELRMDFMIQKKVNGSDVYNTLQMGIRSDGSKYQKGATPTDLNSNDGTFATTAWIRSAAILKSGNRGETEGYEYSHYIEVADNGIGTISYDSRDVIRIGASGNITLSFTIPSEDYYTSTKLIYLRASSASALTIKATGGGTDVHWTGDSPVWGNSGDALIFTATFIWNRVILNVVDSFTG